VSAWGLLSGGVPTDLPREAQAALLLRTMGVAATGQPPPRAGTWPPHEHLRRAWQLPAAADDLLRQALVLCADHEPNAPSFTARCVAATGAGLAAAVTAGLAALSGPRHGGMTARVEAIGPQVESAARSGTALRRWLAEETERHLARRQQRGLPRIAGDAVPGFGEPCAGQRSRADVELAQERTIADRRDPAA